MRRPTRPRGVGLALAALVALGACGISADDDPQAIATDDVPGGLLDPNPVTSTTVPESAGAATTIPVYLLEETPTGVRLVAVDRDVTQAGAPASRLTALFDGATEEEAGQGIISAIPVNTALLGVTSDPGEGEVIVDLSEFPTVEGAALAQAFAQIVYTATEAPGFNQVRFLVDGEPTTVLDGSGAEKEGPVRRTNYLELGPEDPPER